MVSKHMRLLFAAAAAAACVAPGVGLAEPACDVALAALTGIYRGDRGPAALDGKIDPVQVRSYLREGGECLPRAYPRHPTESACGWLDPSGQIGPQVRAPAKQTIDALMKAPVRDASTACSMLKRNTRTVLGWRGRNGESGQRRKSGLYDHTSIGISLPVVNAAQGEAIAWAQSQSGPLAGGGGFVLLRIDAKGRWRLSGRLPVFVS